MREAGGRREVWSEEFMLMRELQVPGEVVRDGSILFPRGPSPSAAVARVLSTLTDLFYVGSVREETVEVFV